jgi:Tfp pilus assembly protein PilO
MESEVGAISHNVSKKRYLASLKFFTSLQQKKSREYTTIILTILALIVFGIFAINPTLSTIVNLRKQLEDNQLLDQQLGEKILSLQSLQREYEELTPDLPLVEAALPPLPETPVLLGQLQSLARKNNLSVTEIQSSKIPYTKEGLGSNKTGSYVVSFTVAGLYTDINQFLKDSTTFDRVVTVDKVTIVRDVQGNRGLQGTADIKAYFDQKPL